MNARSFSEYWPLPSVKISIARIRMAEYSFKWTQGLCYWGMIHRSEFPCLQTISKKCSLSKTKMIIEMKFIDLRPAYFNKRITLRLNHTIPIVSCSWYYVSFSANALWFIFIFSLLLSDLALLSLKVRRRNAQYGSCINRTCSISSKKPWLGYHDLVLLVSPTVPI